MSIEMIKPVLQGIQNITPANSAPKINGVEGAKDKSFGEMFSKAIQEVDQLQKDANRSIEDLSMGKNGVTTHDTMIALEKADAAFQLMSTVRSRIIRAYEEVIRTQV